MNDKNLRLINETKPPIRGLPRNEFGSLGSFSIFGGCHAGRLHSSNADQVTVAITLIHLLSQRV